MDEAVRVEIKGSASGDLLRSLHAALSGEPEWRGRVDVVSTRPVPGTLGGWVEALSVALAPGGAVVVLVGAVVAWARRQSVGDVVCKVSRADGTSVEVSAPLARSLRGPDEVRVLVEGLARDLEAGSSGSSDSSGE
ncbi:hypothetical protein [Streptomyces sp. NPDC087856]|uniref:effector-associated constant component EACC1 n=1 Tax=Streptomyces sp. NPDC087856 TaxID=3365811 RepID=UPI0038267DFF